MRQEKFREFREAVGNFFGREVSVADEGVVEQELFERGVPSGRVEFDGVGTDFGSEFAKVVGGGGSVGRVGRGGRRVAGRAPQQKHSIRLTGGSETNQYYVSLSRIDQNSLYKNDNHWMKRTNFRLATSSLIKEIGLRINATIDGYRQKTTHPYTSTVNPGDPYYSVFTHINDKYSRYPGVNKFGLPYNITDNPVAETAKDAGYLRNTENVINGKGELIWEVPWVKGLKVRAASNYRFYSEIDKSWRKDAGQFSLFCLCHKIYLQNDIIINSVR